MLPLSGEMTVRPGLVAVVAVHDRAVRLLPKHQQMVGQLPLLVAMIAFTVGGLTLLFAA